YHALEKTDGFAMEIDAAELMDSIMKNAIKEAEKDRLLGKQKVKLNRKKLDKSADSLLTSLGIEGDIATKKDLKTIRNRRAAKLLQQGEMPTIVDAYLLGIAKRLGKWTGGIEDVNDQLDLSDELGGELDPESVLVPEKDFRRSLEQLISVYLAQDLTKIDEISNRGYSMEQKDLMLINRNIKMAYRMDSLTHIRAMFFAVGAAHLPGDSGVITLLRNHGYSVEPVFASAKTSADSYASQLQELQWTTVEGDNGAYTVQMPGKATDYNVFGEIVKMKMFFDMTTMSFYFSGHVTGAHVNAGLMDNMLREMVQNMTHKKAPVNSVPVQTAGLNGKEAVAENEEGAYRVRVFVKDKTVFFLMAGALKKKNIHSKDADRFLASLIPGTTELPKKQWETFVLQHKSFSVKVPAKLSLNKAIDERIHEGGEWESLSYNAADPGTGVYYLVQIKQLKPHLFLDGDSTYFERLKEDLKTRVDELTKAEVATYLGYPSLYMEGYAKEVNARYRVLHVTRGNRVYSLLIGIPKGADESDADVFLKSLVFLPFEKVDYTRQQDKGFSTTAPGHLQTIAPDSTASSPFYSAHYLSYNPNAAVAYDVFVNVFSPNYWIANDSTYFHRKIAQYKKYNDSVIKKEWVQNGSVKGMEFVVQMPGYNSLRKVRLLVNGDTLYTLLSMIPSQEIGKDYHQHFFNDFRLVKEVPPAIYTSKAGQLLNALQSADSLVFEDAKENLDLVEFEKKDLPLLHQALVKQYRDSNEYDAVSAKLVNIVSSLADSTTVAFIKKEYASLQGSRESLRYDLLTLLAKAKTASSYTLLKEFILTQLPAGGDVQQLQYALLDSLSLTATLFPDILKKNNDSLFGRVAVVLTNRLLDSSVLTIDMIRPYQDQLIKGAQIAAAAVKRDTENAWEFVEWSSLLGRLNSTGGNAVLRQMLIHKDIYLKQHIILALLQNNLAVSAAEIIKVAADKSQRSSFYEELKKLKKEALFPAVYTTQKSLAESDLYGYFSDEYESFTLTYVGERTEEYNGAKKRFHLFKVRLAYDEEDTKQTFLAVAGPYDLATKEKLPYSDISGFYADEEFHPTKINRLLKAYLEQMKPAEE
ncbi:MAG TPA: TraB/GumN family protein, partial [Flavisolibacter sp.]|nr:TraB/GumN family protein [Flavisolibacter sp.]